MKVFLVLFKHVLLLALNKNPFLIIVSLKSIIFACLFFLIIIETIKLFDSLTLQKLLTYSLSQKNIILNLVWFMFFMQINFTRSCESRILWISPWDIYVCIMCLCCSHYYSRMVLLFVSNQLNKMNQLNTLHSLSPAEVRPCLLKGWTLWQNRLIHSSSIIFISLYLNIVKSFV